MSLLTRSGSQQWSETRMCRVLRGVGAGRVSRDRLYGDLAPWMLEGRSVSWPLVLLALQGLVRFDVFGVEAPRLTARGLDVLVTWG